MIRSLIYVACVGLGLPLQADLLSGPEGQQLTGQVLKSEGDLLEFEHPSASDVLELRLSALEKIEFESDKGFETGPHEMTLVDGSVLRGTFLDFDGEVVEFRSDLAGRLQVERNQVARIAMQGGSGELLFSSRGTAEQWVIKDEKHWKFDSEARSMNNEASTAEAGLMLPLGDHYRISFDVTWKRNLRFELLFGGQELRYDTKSARYKLLVNRSDISLMRNPSGITRSASIHDRRGVELSALRRANQAHFEIEVEPRNRRVRVLMNGEVVREFQDSINGFAHGGAILLRTGSTHQSFQNFSVSNQVGDSDGLVDRPLAADRIQIKDSEVSGEIRALKDLDGVPHAVLLGEIGGERHEFTVDLNQVVFMHFKGPALPQRGDGDLVKSASSDRLYGEFVALTADSLTVDQPLLGTLQLKRQAVGELQLKRKETP